MSFICERLTTRKLETLANHKYNATGTTLLDPLMQKYWRWFVDRVVPLWWAPNAMTLVGLISNIFTACLLVHYSQDARQQIPAWPLLLCAFGLFVYQTLDACDGKQARRTNTSSCLGELFDHGCDAVSTIFVSLSVCLSVQLGEQANLMLILCVMATALFYMAHWQTYVTGELRFAKFDVTEAQMSIIVILLVSAVFGTDFWTYEIPWLLHVKLQSIPLYFSIGNEILIFTTNLKAILSGGAGRNGSSVAGTSILSPSTPIVISVVMALTIFFKSTSNVFVDHICLYLITFGLVTAKLTCKLVVAQMSKSPIDKLDSVLVGPLLLFLNQYFSTLVSEYPLLWTALLYIILDFLYYSYSMCNQIADHLRISILSIKPKEPKQSVGSNQRVNAEVTTNGRASRHRPYNLRQDNSR